VIEAVKILDGKRVDFEYEGDMAAMSRSIRNWRRLSVQPVVRPGQCAGDAGVPLGLDLDQDAAGTRRRTVIGPLLVGSTAVQICSSAPRTTRSSTWRRCGV